MKTVKITGYAKVNLFLDVLGKKDNYHMLDSIVCTVNTYDKLTLSTRKDKKINVKQAGFYRLNNDILLDNAEKAAKAFIEKYDTNGVDIIVNKNIPIAAGMGGSSADIAAVLKGMKVLYDINDDILLLANQLGSDSGYLLTGGYARLSGKGDIIMPLDIDKKLYMVIVVAEGGVNTSKCFKKFDENVIKPISNGAERFLNKLLGGGLDKDSCYNALYFAATQLNPNIEKVYSDILSLSPLSAVMTGSGSAVLGIFDTFELALWAKDKLIKKYKTVILTETLTQSELASSTFYTKNLYKIN